MAIVTKNREVFNCSLMFYCKSNFNYSYMTLSSLTYIHSFSVKYAFSQLISIILIRHTLIKDDIYILFCETTDLILATFGWDSPYVDTF
jgi:subtilase family serine protease